MKYLARMTLSQGACCATGELCGFSLWTPHDFNYRGGFDSTIKTVCSYAAPDVLKRGYGRSGDSYYGTGNTPEEAWNNCLKMVQERVDEYSYKGYQLRYFWFVHYHDSDDYENDELRQIVKKLPNVTPLGAFVNANTYNTVDGYMVAFENTTGDTRDDEEEDDDY